MYYYSTRSQYKTDDVSAVIDGIAPDGGLYIDPELKNRPFDWQACLKLSAIDMAKAVLKHLLPGFEDMDSIVESAYKDKFPLPELTPLKQLGEDYVLELFHGPSCAFKDIALSVLPRLMSAARAQKQLKEKILILTATSGDTGKAALEGFQDVEGSGIIVFYPAEGVSAIQKAQMVTQEGRNVRVCAVEGNFDDCQSGVKKAFSQINSSAALQEKGLRLSSANSINIGRLAPQVVYYFSAYAALAERGVISIGDEIDFSVPTGNFGDILAGYYAKQMGLPIGSLVCASNENNVLTEFIRTGVYDKNRRLKKTSSPSMDILLSSNLERLIFDAADGDYKYVKENMESLAMWGTFRANLDVLLNVQDSIEAGCCSEQETAQTVNKLWQDYSYLADPHTAVAYHAAQEYKKSSWEKKPMVILSTASPFKFPEAVLSALGQEQSGSAGELMEKLSAFTGLPIPPQLAALKDKAVLHRDTIGRDEICSYVLKALSDFE